METLEDYLATDYLAAKQEITDIDRTLRDVMETFTLTFDATLGWPYDYQTDTGISTLSTEPSQGTLAMVLIATGRLLGHCALPKKTYAKVGPKDFVAMRARWASGFALLQKSLIDKNGVDSGTFGKDNPLTLSFVSELAKLLSAAEYEAQKKALFDGVTTARTGLSASLGKDISGADLLQLKEKKYLQNVFVPLRMLRAASDLDFPHDLRLRHRSFFEKSLHQQLSFSSIPDSRFDPAELIFSLEGLLLCAREAVDSTVFNRVLQVLEKEQGTSAHWRPNKPMFATSQGEIALPVSVEGANSLMRSIAIMDDGLFYETFTAKSLPLVRRFWHWLRARSVRFEKNASQYVGWHSEHVNDQNLIHLWDTSQVAEFMIFFREILERHIATQTLRLSRLSVKQSKAKSSASAAISAWDKCIADFEPAMEAVPAQQIYRLLKADFVEGWAKEKPVNFSMLLYGPPGTGKTTVAENLADTLEMRLITVTVSDFLGAGGENVEARAKAIFQTLEAQERTVILFDEIDSFLLDRNSKLYRNQTSLFQFLTPGMLTKIADLRKAKRSIFIIATNYADRIDSAIKRTGRIDEKYLLPLPNAKRRIAILKELGFNTPPDTKQLEAKTAFFGYSDLKGAVEEASRNGGTEDVLGDILCKSEPATGIKSYLARLSEDEVFPRLEFESLRLIAEEVQLLDVEKEINEVAADDEKKKLLEKYDLLKYGTKK